MGSVMRGLTSILVILSTFASLTLKLKAQYLLPIAKHEPTKQFYTTFNVGSTTVVPYTRLRSDIYTALARSFTEKENALGISKISQVAPFKDCFFPSPDGRKGTGPNVPVIEFGLPGRAGEVKWGFHSANTVVKVQKTVMCLAFIDGGERPRDIMVLGTHQLQDYIVDLDFSRTILAFSDSLLLHNTSCSAWPPQK